MSLNRCNALMSDAYWSDHRCGLKKGHDGWHRCFAVYWEKKRRIVKPCGYNWNGSATVPDEILDYTMVHAES